MEVKTIASGSTGNAYEISHGQNKLLLECGIPVAKIREHTKLQELDGCLISHEHGDHSKAVEQLLRAAVTCHMSYGTAHALKVETHHRVKILPKESWWKIGPWAVLGLPTIHDAAEPLSFICAIADKALFFLTDSAYCLHSLKGLTHVMIECNYMAEALTGLDLRQRRRLINSHMSLETVVGFFRNLDKTKLESVHLLHLSARNADETKMKQAIQAETGVPVYVCEERK